MVTPEWTPSPPGYTNANSLMLLLRSKAQIPPPNRFENIVKESDNFSIRFPTESVRCKVLKEYVSQAILEKHINSVYPVLHENVLELYCDFIDFKKNNGSRIEKEFYKDMSLKDFVNRLIRKRAVMFMGKYDKYMLINGRKGSGKWETIGTDRESYPLLLRDCLSYDEVKLSAFLSVSSYTYFVNVGDRRNMSKYSHDRSKIEDEGIIIGMIGPRLVKENVQEFQEIVISEKQNKPANGYGNPSFPSIHKLFAKFYMDQCWTFDDLVIFRKKMSRSDGSRFVNLNNDKYIFDNHLYYKRLTFSFDTLFLEANQRAKEVNKNAYIHIVGLGLGVWRISAHQQEVYVEALYKRIVYLGFRLSSVSDIHLSYINQPHCGGFQNGDLIPIDGHPLNGIRVHISNRDPHEKLKGPNAGKLLVVSYAWDGNALPGNEFWEGQLGSSGDSAAASSTQITEIHNPHINCLVCADNLRVVCENGVIPFELYEAKIRKKFVKVNPLRTT